MSWKINFTAPMEMGRERECCVLSTSPGCRRAASFPFVGDSSIIQASSLKVRSKSESEALNKMRLTQMNLETVRKRLSESTIKEKVPDEGSDYQSHSSSSSECEVDDLELFCAGPLELKEEEKLRKSVRFADDCGHELYMVRVATEPSNCPPKLSPSVLRRYRGESFEEEEMTTREPAPVWNLMFKQPAADYVRFRENMETNKVSLENVILNNEAYKVMGTIKVGNIAFEKSVFVRYTMNGWISYMDKAAIYQPSTSKIQDTFKFDLDLPSSVEKIHQIEFCICFKANGTEYWDSNSGTNYVLHCEQQQHPAVPQQRRASLFGSSKYLDRDDAYKLDYNDWGKFASWKALSTDGPYW
eukprot:NP_001024738.1 Protein phosphatase 1 regulatory subunit [Caenorhabditis elegans]